MTTQITSDQRWDFIKKFGDWLGGNVSQARADVVLQNPDLFTQNLQDFFNPPEEKLSVKSAKWVEQILKAENQAHQNFFGQVFDLALFRETLEKCGKKKIMAWRKRGREIHFLPPFVFTQGLSLSGWKIKPEKWFWEQLSAGKLFLKNGDGKLVKMERVEFLGQVVLVDVRLKPIYENGKQIYEDDDMGFLIQDLRNQGQLSQYSEGPQTSRFGISPNEWESHMKQAVSLELGVSHRLETVIEANVIPQLYLRMPRKNDGTTNTREWREENFEDASRRLRSGFSVLGGLAFVNWVRSDYRWNYNAVRPLGVVA